MSRLSNLFRILGYTQQSATQHLKEKLTTNPDLSHYIIFSILPNDKAISVKLPGKSTFI